jgi:hypothetical protein
MPLRNISMTDKTHPKKQPRMSVHACAKRPTYIIAEIPHMWNENQREREKHFKAEAQKVFLTLY